ncbi:MAG: SxtJ family membrane protein [Planctomycetota bacterium]|jgi:hypothetical protein
MAIVEINWNPPERDLRVFSGLLIAFTAFVAWSIDAEFASPIAQLVAGVGLVFGGIGIAAPKLIQPLYVGWMVAVSPIAFVVSNTILAAVFFLVVWPLAILMRLKHRDALRLEVDRSAETYWLPRQPQRDPRRYFRQY